ncbi:MAG: ATP-binding protein [bacterium]
MAVYSGTDLFPGPPWWTHWAVIQVTQLVFLSAVVVMLFCYRSQVARHKARIRRLEEQISEQSKELRMNRYEFERRVDDRTAELTRSTLLLKLENTERQRAQEALARSETRNRALLSAIPDVILRMDENGRLLDFHTGKGYSPWENLDEKIGKSIMHVIPPDAAEQTLVCIQEALRTQEVQRLEFRVPASREIYVFESRIVTGGEHEVLAIIRDITELKRLENEILDISNREQTRLGQDLHDGLGQHLTGISFLSRGLYQKLQSKTIEEARDALEITELVKQAIQQIRGLARGLLPMVVEDEGLESALFELASTTSRVYRVACEFTGGTPLDLLNPSLANHIYRIAQEAVSNAVKHAKAAHIGITLQKAGQGLILMVDDDGAGFAEGWEQRGGMGLRIMRYRAGMIGAKLMFQRSEDGHTRVICTVPPESYSG